MRKSTGAKRWIAAGAIGAALLAGCDSSSVDETTRDESGQIVGEGELGAFALKVGDCFDEQAVLSGEPFELVSVGAVPCSEPHTAEVVSVNDTFFEGEDSLPAQDVVDSRSAQACLSDLVAYTGQPYEESLFDVIPLTPTQDSWDILGDRGLACIGITLSQETGMPIESNSSMRAS
jgi:hypothetical protein